MIGEKKTLDIVLLILFIAELGGRVLPVPLHIGLGVVLYLLVLAHLWLNRNFFSTLSKGTYSRRRILNTGSILLLLGCFVLIFLSGAGLVVARQTGTSPVFWQGVHGKASIGAFVLALIHGALQGRRYLQGWKLKGALALVVVLTAGVVAGIPYVDRWFHPVVVNKNDVISGEKLTTSKKVLTVYFGRIGNTDFPDSVDAVSGASLMRNVPDGKLLGNSQVLAWMVQDAVGGDVAAILTEKKYPAGYGEVVKVGREEIKHEERLVLKPMAVHPEDYDVIVLVYPIWWGTTPRAVNSFLEAHDLKGKVLLPIATHGGSGKAASLESLRNSTQADVKEPLAVYSSDIPRMRGRVGEYLKKAKSEEQRAKSVQHANGNELAASACGELGQEFLPWASR